MNTATKCAKRTATKKLTAAALVVTLGVGLGAAALPAGAEDGGTTTTTTTKDTTTSAQAPERDKVARHRRPWRAAMRGERFQAELAEELGITVEKLRAAEKAVMERRLEEAVQNGRISAEKAQQIRDRIAKRFGG